MLSHAVLKKQTALTKLSNTKVHNFPSSIKKTFFPNSNKVRLEIQKPVPKAPGFEAVLGPRTNDMNIQMLSRSIFDQIFTNANENKNAVIMEECLRDLRKHNMVTKEGDFLKDVDFRVPPLEGRNIEEHFWNIGNQQLKPYQCLIESLLKESPKPPDEWSMQPGWTRYAPGVNPEPVSFPLEEALVFDIEVCMVAGKVPTLATAVSDKAWYGWVSQALIDGTSKPITTHHYPMEQLIPIESAPSDRGLTLTPHMKSPKIIVGHNVSFDRARIKEQYFVKNTGTRFLDTMSLHVCVSGLTSYQRAVLKSGKFEEEDEDWMSVSALNSLSEVHKLYCGRTLSKDTRDIFVKGTLSDVRRDFQQVMTYCSGDVGATQDVLRIVFPLFVQRFPHPVTLVGMLELGGAYLPVNSNWCRYVESAEQAYEDLDIERQMLLARRADQACQLLHEDKYKESLWLWDQVWDTRNLRIRQNPPKPKTPVIEPNKPKTKPKQNLLDPEEVDPLEEKFRYLHETRDLLYKIKPHLAGYPEWYRKLCTKPDSSPDWVPGPHLISTSMQIAPKLLSLTWEGYPLHYVREKGWGFLVPFTDDLDTKRKLPLKQLLEKCPLEVDKAKEGRGEEAFAAISKLVEENLMRKEFYSKLKKDRSGGHYRGTGTWCDLEIDDCCYFIKLPHKNGAAHNVGNPLSKDFLNKFSENVLAGDTESAEAVLSIARMLSYWRNNRNRVHDQMVVWLDENMLSGPMQEKGGQFGAIIPQVVVCGTLTRRAVEPTWMTASNAQKDRVGSELRAMIQSPPGYCIVGADVDSQELWIASVIGDAAHAQTHGCTPLGWMTLSGSKSDGTDMHSVTAKAVGISRDHAKVINYARIYGAGQNFAERLLRQFNPAMSEAEARTKAAKMFALTKGKRIFHLRKEFAADLPEEGEIYSKWHAHQVAKSFGRKVDEMFVDPKWVSGTESAMCNRLEEIANSLRPRTPFLDCALTRALEPKGANDDRFLPTRVNWVVQSGAVDFLHLMLVCMRWIMGENARFCLSFHDEIRYLVPEKYKYQAALAMHVTNLLTRAFCSARLGINDLPQSVAFFSTVEVDTALRKDAKMDCETPSNPHGLDKGYNVKNGEALDVHQAVEKARGKYRCWYEQLR